ncbi:hypothetical protein BamMEX5DRAFT_6132 [Burkholderia ambifaria MEX-5]|uniref:Integrase catalytic region n=1 Tax=Burkholderia ambifaria MEX-5 TaxID=396597 RepID=B1TEB6_9BURK|nr:helix-turn-helix domain-containing protein [Burkholderia ambifaria]EDT38084.1 hypothetical protein BamMEX5DRAFT_6132 [Burkholderia ambifaria MEX-5]
MTIPVELEAQILRLYHAEKWPCGTIAKQLHVHRETVQRVLIRAGLPRIGPVPKPSMIEPYLPFIRQTLEKYPSLTASRLYFMVRERGYKGAPDHFRHLISLHRPRKPAEAFLRLRTLPGEQAQVDWGHFGYIEIGRARRPLMAFVMVLSYSRDIYLRFFLDARMEIFEMNVESYRRRTASDKQTSRRRQSSGRSDKHGRITTDNHPVDRPRWLSVNRPSCLTLSNEASLIAA